MKPLDNNRQRWIVINWVSMTIEKTVKCMRLIRGKKKFH